MRVRAPGRRNRAGELQETYKGILFFAARTPFRASSVSGRLGLDQNLAKMEIPDPRCSNHQHELNPR